MKWLISTSIILLTLALLFPGSAHATTQTCQPLTPVASAVPGQTVTYDMGTVPIDGSCQSAQLVVSTNVPAIRTDVLTASASGCGAPTSGWACCDWAVSDVLAGQTIATWEIYEQFYIEPFSNLDRYLNPPLQAAHMTSAGTLLGWTPESPSGWAMATAWYNSNAISAISVGADWRLDYSLGTPLTAAYWPNSFNGIIQSPGLSSPSPPLCEGTFSGVPEGIVPTVVGPACAFLCGISFWQVLPRPGWLWW